MKSFEQACTRIAAALDMLVAEEALAVKSGNYDAALETQHRAEPLVGYLVAHAAGSTGARSVIEALRARRQETSERLEAEMARMTNELCALEFSRRQLGRIGPAYGGIKREPRLTAIG